MSLLDGSGLNREVPAPFCEKLGVKFPKPTLHMSIPTMLVDFEVC